MLVCVYIYIYVLLYIYILYTCHMCICVYTYLCTYFQETIATRLLSFKASKNIFPLEPTGGTFSDDSLRLTPGFSVTERTPEIAAQSGERPEKKGGTLVVYLEVQDT